MKNSNHSLRTTLAIGIFACLATSQAHAQTSPAANAPAADTATVPSQPYVWKSVTIVAGGYVPGIIFSPIKKGMIFCRTDIGGGYRWDDDAKRWVGLTDWMPPNHSNLMGCESIALDPVDSNKVYVAAGMYTSSRDSAILRSSDGGKTFAITSVPFVMGGNNPGRGVGERLAIDPNDTSILYFASRQDGLWMSTDSAVTWKKVDGFPIDGGGRGGNGAGLSFVVFDPRSGSQGKASNTLYVGSTDPGDNHLLRSKDAGKTWESVPGQPPANYLPNQAQLDKNGILYLTYGNGVAPTNVSDGGVIKLDTNTGVWTNITPTVIGANGISGFCGLSLDHQHPDTLVVSTMDHFSPMDEVYRSTDGGKTWKGTQANAVMDDTISPYLGPLSGRKIPKFGWWISALAIDPFDSNHVMFGTGATIYGSNDFMNVSDDKPTHWTVAGYGIEETAVLALISPPAGPHLISGEGDIGGYRHDDFNISPPDGMSSNPVFNNTTSLDYAELKPEIVVRTGTANPSSPVRGTAAYSEDGGATWKPFTLPAAAGGARRGGGGGGGGVILSSEGTTFMTTGGAPSISTDRGQTWTPSQGLPAGLQPVADRASPKKFYALDLANNQIYVSTDGGATFSAKPEAGLPAAGAGRGRRGGGGGGGANGLRSVAGHEGDLWILSNGSFYHSTDGGSTFAQAGGSVRVNNYGFGMAAPGKSYPAIFMFGTVNGLQAIFRSDDEANSWVRINDDAHQYGAQPNPIIGDPRVYGRVYIGTNGRGIFYADIAPAAGK